MCYAFTHLSNTNCLLFVHSMVTQAGQPSGWPVSDVTGTANLV
ncbi:ash family protein [Buttiauxella ferragutiae]|nr:ash family protein [Buttiauxella ferragutiae]